MLTSAAPMDDEVTPTEARAEVPHRPRLADYVLARQHRTASREGVALVHQHTGETWHIGRREWVILLMADGTRDRDGLLLAAAREGAVASPEALDALLVKMAAAGLLDEGPRPMEEPRPPRDDAARPLDALPGYTFSCDGRGTCCRQYATVVFSGLEAARARVLLPLLEQGGDRHEHVFTPRHGSTPGAAWAVKHVDGACCYLDAHGLCRIHAAGGPAAKPVGCDLFPARFVDDGEAIRVSPVVECACVVRSATHPADGAGGLVPEGATLREHLRAESWVEVLPDSIALCEGVSVPRADFVAWSRRVLQAQPDDVGAWLWWCGEVMTSEARLPSPDATPEVDIDAMRPWFAALRARLHAAAMQSRVWRAPDDVMQYGVELMTETCTLLLEQDGVLEACLDAGPARPAEEALYLRAAAHGHHWADGSSVAMRVRNMSLRVLIARVIARLIDGNALATKVMETPITTVEALCRGYGLYATNPR